MFAARSAGSQPTTILDLLALANLAPGGGVNPPLPANSPAGGQTLPAQPGMFAGGGPTPPPRQPGPNAQLPPGVSSPQGGGFMPSQPAPQSPQEAYQRMMGSAGGPMNLQGGPDVLNTGPLASGAPDFAMGRDLANLAQPPHVNAKPYKGMFPGKDWISIAGILSDAIAAGFGGQPQFGPMKMRERAAEQEHNRNLDLYRQKTLMEREERMRPRVEQVGNSIGMLNPDPTAPSFQSFYTAPGAPEQYALARGFQPGSAEFADAVQEFRLGSWSDPAMAARTELEGTRYGYRESLQDDRLATSRRNTDVRAGATRRGQDMTDRRGRRGQDMSDARGRVGQQMGDARGRQGAGFNREGGASVPKGEGETATNPKTGHRIRVIGGKWVDLETGRPVQ